MQSSINHVVVLVVFQPHISKSRSHLPPASACHFTRSSAWARHTKDDICIGLCGGKLAYRSCLLSLLHSFLSVTQFFNLYLLREGFLSMIALSCFSSLSSILLLIRAFTHIHTWELHRSTCAVRGPHALSNQLCLKSLNFDIELDCGCYAFRNFLYLMKWYALRLQCFAEHSCCYMMHVRAAQCIYPLWHMAV